jgi:hypothetical protein
MSNTEVFETKFIVKEDGHGNPYLLIEWMKQTQTGPKDTVAGKLLSLKFAKPTTYEQAQGIAREMNSRFVSLAITS